MSRLSSNKRTRSQLILPSKVIGIQLPVVSWVRGEDLDLPEYTRDEQGNLKETKQLRKGGHENKHLSHKQITKDTHKFHK